MDELYTIRVRGLHGNWSAVIEDKDGNPMTDNRYDRIIRLLQESQTAYIYLAYGYSTTKKRDCHKIGFSVDPDRRLSGLRLVKLHSIPCSYRERRDFEEMLQGYFIEQGKWLGGEWFDLTEDDESLIMSLSDTRDILMKCKTRMPWGMSAEFCREMVNEYKKQQYQKRLRASE